MWSVKQLIKATILLFFVALLFHCQQDIQPTPSSSKEYLNLQPDVKYVGMATCRSCHTNIHKTFQHTGMGRSFDHATHEKTDASFGDHALVYDEISNLYYFPFFKDSVLYVREFRLENGDTSHQRVEKIDYIIGSGQHTNSHILNFNGYVFQAPITYYTQEKKWDMAPGFQGNNLRFGRFLTSECLTCHNHFPTLEKGALHKYKDMPRGIECERCHGPGEIHAREKLAGNQVDTSQFIDYTIINPRDLPRDLQMDLCQRCHLQGVAVLEDDKTFYDFKPGMKLNEIMNVFLPRYTNSHEKFIMASQADRLRLSACYKNSELSCITCHNPHKSVEITDKNQYNQACEDCHQAASSTPDLAENLAQVTCAASIAERANKKDDCVSCHMPRSGSIDIPHVNITDHFIGKKKEKQTQHETAAFLGLKILTKDKASPLDMAKGYIAMYDKYVQSPIILDSAKYYLDRAEVSFEKKFKTFVHYFFAKEDYQNILALAPQFPVSQIKDGWTTYRIGQAFYSVQQYEQALKYYQKTVEFLPLHLEFQEKLGTTLFLLQRLPEAKEVFEFIIKEDSKRPVALTNLGYILAISGDLEAGEKLYDEAIALDPDYEQALLNKAAILMLRKDKIEAQQFLKRILKINPENVQAAQALKQL